jgi:hypothetical protein
MSRRFYCAECGKVLIVSRKALPKYATIIDVVEVHKCSKEPIEFDLEPVIDYSQLARKDGKFVKKLNDLNPPAAKGIFGGVSTEDLRDRRFDSGPALTKINKESPKSTAPKSILNIIEQMELTNTPENSINDSESEELNNG